MILRTRIGLSICSFHWFFGSSNFLVKLYRFGQKRLLIGCGFWQKFCGRTKLHRSLAEVVSVGIVCTPPPVLFVIWGIKESEQVVTCASWRTNWFATARLRVRWGQEKTGITFADVEHLHSAVWRRRRSAAWWLSAAGRAAVAIAVAAAGSDDHLKVCDDFVYGDKIDRML